jgi:ferritin-like metal-binding protein YciE
MKRIFLIAAAAIMVPLLSSCFCLRPLGGPAPFGLTLVPGIKFLDALKSHFVEPLPNIQDLLVHELRKLTRSEKELQNALPRLIKKAPHTSLKNLLKHHALLSQDHKEESEEILQTLNREDDADHPCSAMKGLIDELVNSMMPEEAQMRDILLITGFQKIESYKISGYNNAKTYASLLHLRKAERSLRKIVEEERDERELLNQLFLAILPKADSKRDVANAMVISSSGLKEIHAVHDKDEIESPGSDSTQEIKSPGGRAGTSHRTYGRGQSRGH